MTSILQENRLPRHPSEDECSRARSGDTQGSKGLSILHGWDPSGVGGGHSVSPFRQRAVGWGGSWGRVEEEKGPCKRIHLVWDGWTNGLMIYNPERVVGAPRPLTGGVYIIYGIYMAGREGGGQCKPLEMWE